MSEDDRRRRRARVRNIVKISVIVLLITAVLTFACVRPDWTLIKRAITPADSVHRGIVNGGERLSTDTVWTTVPDETVVVPKTRSSTGHPRNSSWPRNTSGFARQDNTAEVGRSAARGRALTVVRGQSIKRILPPTDHASRNGTFANDEGHENVESAVSPHTGVFRMKIRSNQRQINNYDDFTVPQTDMPTVENDALAGYYNAYDFTFNNGDKDSKEGKHSDDAAGWSPMFRHEQEPAGEPSPTGTSSGLSGSGHLKPPPVGLGARYSADQDNEYRVQSYTSNGAMYPWEQLMTYMSPSYWMGSAESQSKPVGSRQVSTTLQPPTVDNRQLPNTPPVQGSAPGQLQQQTIASIPTVYDINWRRIGAMAVVKLGLVKLKAIGFVNILLFLLFKIKMFMAVIFFKFLSLLKFIKLFKFLIIPLLVIPFFPVLASLIYPMNRANPQVFPTSSTNLVNFNVRPDGSSEESGERVFIPGETILIPGSSTTVTRPQNVPFGGIPDGVTDAFSLLSGQRYEPSALLDPELDLFRKELDSEKCVERIACKMAATGKAGIMPLWINWMLHGMTKSIPNDKFVYYLKAYDDVTNEIHTESPNPDNWEKWCFERYDCDNETDETDTR